MKTRYFIFFVLGLCVPFLAGYFFIKSGFMPVATRGPALPFEEKIAHMALRAAIGDQSKVSPPFPADEANLKSGAKVYAQNCAVCHGLQNGKATAIAKGLFPQPPKLFTVEDVVTKDAVGKIYWIVKNGIRLTGMPGFVDELTNAEIWQVSLVLKHADHLPESVIHELGTANP